MARCSKGGNAFQGRARRGICGALAFMMAFALAVAPAEATQASQTAQESKLTYAPARADAAQAAEATQVPGAADAMQVPRAADAPEAASEPRGDADGAGGDATPETFIGAADSESPTGTESAPQGSELGTPQGSESGAPASSESAAPQISIQDDKGYAITSIGEEVRLPECKVTGAAAGSSVVWTDVSSSSGIIEIENGDAAGVSAIAKRAGVATLRAQLSGSEDVYDEYRIVVRPAVPETASVADRTYDSVTLKWGAVPDAEGYAIYRKAPGETSETEIETLYGVNSVTFTDKDVQLGAEYEYGIHAFISYNDENGVSQRALSESKATVKSSPELGKVEIIGIKEAAEGVTLSWKPLEGASGYTIYRASGEGEFSEIASVDAGVTSYNDREYQDGEDYRYNIAAYRESGGGKAYGPHSDVLSLDSGSGGIKLTITDSDYQSVSLSWTKEEGADGYAIDRKAGKKGEFLPLVTINSGEETEYVDRTVQIDTKYYYRVRSFRTSGGSTIWGAYSGTKNVTPNLDAPAVAVEQTTFDSVTISWKRVDGVKGYRVLRSDTGEEGSFKSIALIKNDETFQHTDTGLSLGVTHYYRVCGYRGVNGKKVNGKKSAPVAASAVPAAPIAKAEAAGTTSVRLSWEKVGLPSTGSGYYIYQVNDGADKMIADCPESADGYTVDGLRYGERYSFRVSAYVTDASGNALEGTRSETVSATPGLPSVSISSVEADSYQEIRVTWSKTEHGDEDSYVVYRSEREDSGYEAIATVPRQEGISTYSYTDENVAVGKTYFYKLSCKKELPSGTVIESALSEAKSLSSSPAAPVVSIKAVQYDSITLAWKKVGALTEGGYVDGYEVYRSNGADGKFKKLKTVSGGDATTYKDEGIVTGNTYFYKVRAFCKIGSKYAYSEYSETVQGTPAPAAPSFKAKSTSFQTVTLTWKPVNGCDGYVVYRAANEDGEYKKAKTLSSDKNMYADSKLSTGKTYYYKMRAYRMRSGKKIFGAYSEAQSATPELGKVAGLKATPTGNNKIQLKWKAVEGAKTYTVLRCKSVSGNYKIATEICNTNSYLDANVTPGKTYYYKVYAVRGKLKGATSEYASAVSASLSIGVSKVVMQVNTSIKVTATAKPSAPITWSTGDPSVALVTAEGVVYGLKVGTTTLTASANGLKKSIPVTVKKKVSQKVVEIGEGQGKVDFAAMKAAGYDAVVLRLMNGLEIDSRFESNFSRAKAAGLKVGVSCYAMARNRADADQEGRQLLSILGGRALDLPIVYDMEEVTLLYGLTNADRAEIIDGFKGAIEAGGQKFVLQASLEWLNQYLDAERLKGVSLWVINIRAEGKGHGYTGSGKVVMWRYKKGAKVPGVEKSASVSVKYKS